jgi:acyl-CoA synthetase (AMP-forming)/AMP-acid ligase II
MLGLMQTQPLLISSIIAHAARHHQRAEVVSRMIDGSLHRTDYPTIERRARKLAAALQSLGVERHDRVATLAWNGFRHLELYYGVSGMGSVVHTVNPRLAPDDIAWIIRDAGSVVLFAELSFIGLLETIAPQIPDVRAIVLLAERSEMPAVTPTPGQEVLCYEEIVAAAGDGFAWPVLDENLASGLCYTSGTTGRPKGVLYTHRSTLIHAYALNSADVFGLRSVDRVLPIVPMFHVNAWGLPYAVPLAGASFVMPGRHLDGPSVAELMNGERVTFSAGVPTVWMGLLAHLQKTGERLTTLKRLVTGGSACPPSLAEAFERDYGVSVIHAWGMTETSPLGTIFAPLPGFEALSPVDQRALMLKQGRPVPGLQIRIVDDQNEALPWDGKTFGNLQARGPWVLQRYFRGEMDAADPDGWFATGDVATIDADGFLEITDRTKDVVKSGGEWISSIQLENIAVSHPDVAEAAVVAARHPRWDERPLLIVVAKPDRTIDPAALLAMYDGQVAKWWIPDEVVIVDELPHTATGKLNKLALRQQFRGFQLASVTAE